MGDLVIVLPGIMGSSLHRNGTALWDPEVGGLVGALISLKHSLPELTLPPGIGDSSPEDGVYAHRLINDVHVIPGVWLAGRGYSQLLTKLRKKLGFDEATGNLLPLPYDWRLSIPAIVTALTPRIDRALEVWRAKDPANADARIVFVAHSMGGLVARAYTTTHRDEVRKIITMGTPSRGSFMALRAIAQGLGPNRGRLRELTSTFAATLPGLHHLLPAYACVDTDGRRRGLLPLNPADITGVDTTMATDGIRFLTGLADAEDADPRSSDRLHSLIGWKQETVSSMRLEDGQPTFLATIGEHTITGDGIVPAMSAAPRGISLDSPLLHGYAEQHGNLQSNRYVLAEVARILTNAPPIVFMGDAVEVGLTVPDLVHYGDDLTVRVTLATEADDAIAVVLRTEQRNVERRPQIRDGQGQVTFRDVPPGVHAVEVRGVHSGSPVRSVTGTVTVWDDSWSTP